MHQLSHRAPTWGLIVLLVACGGSEDSATTDRVTPMASIDACNLLSAADVGDVLGTTVSAPNKRESGGDEGRVTICVYDGGWPNNANITIRQSEHAGRPGTSAALATELNEAIDQMTADSSMANLVEGGRWEPLELGGHAGAVRDAGEGGWTLVMRKDGLKAVEVLVNAPNREAAVTLGRKVMERLDLTG